MTLESFLSGALDERRAQHRYRQRRLVESPQGACIRMDGRELLAFSSNDYLGLANHPRVVAAFQQAANQYGVGSGASHLICGHSSEHHALEEELADFCGRPRALLFSTGYMANLGVISALVGRGDGVFEDRLNHASLLDGGLLSGARFQRYVHNDPSVLATQLAKPYKHRLVCTDGVFSMDGDVAPLPELANTCDQHHAWLMVDDAHGFGVLGKNGGGVAELFGLSGERLPILMATLGKAVGTFGAFVAGSVNLIEYLVQFSRSYIYTTAMPPAIAAATRASLRLVWEENWRRQQLQNLIALFRRGASELGLALMDSATPIQPVLVGSDADVLKIGDHLYRNGFHVGTIRSPTVPKGSARLRITLTAAHGEEDVLRLLDALQQAFAAVELDHRV